MQLIKIPLSLIFLVINSQLFSQYEWKKIYGDDRHNAVFELIESYDYGYVLGGLMYNNTGQKVTYSLVIKTDINGEVLWEKKIGGNPPPGETGGTFLKQTNDGGLIITGTTYLYDAWGDAFILKLNACGEKEWSKIFYNTTSYEHGGNIEIMDNGSYVAMIKYWGDDLANDRIWLFNIDQKGDIIWQKVYAKWTLGTNAEEGRNLIKNHKNEFLITGEYFQYNPGEDTNARIVRPMFIQTDSLGNEQWHVLWGVNEYFYGAAFNSICNLENSVYSVGQNSSISHPGDRPVLFKISESGSQLFYKDLIEDADGGGATTISILEDSVLFIGATWQDLSDSIHNGVLKTDTLGDILKQRDLLTVGNAFNSSIISHDNKYLVTGSFYTDHSWNIYLWKFNRNLEYDSIYTKSRVYDSLCPYQIRSDTIDLDTTMVNLQELYKQMHQIKVYPNPAKSKITVTLGDLAYGTELILYNTKGQVIRRQDVSKSKKVYHFDVNSLPGGIYIVAINNNSILVDKQKVIIGNR